MAKRRISDQQKRRIENIQQKRRDKAGKNSTQKQASLNDQGLGAEQAGEIRTNFGQSLVVEDQNKNLFRCVARQNLGAIVCGDRVIWQKAQNDEGVIVAVEERTSLLQKPGFGGKLKPMAANIDQIIIVSSVQPPPNPYLIDRYLIAAENLPATPVILLNKTDLLDESNRSSIEAIENEYTSIGYKIIKASNVLNHGFNELQKALKTRTSIFVGLSGVGKSSLINHISPELDIRVGGLSEASGEGKHTTTSSTLYHLECGGKIIDSPGVRDFGLWNSSADDILYGFKELRPFIGQCKFSNCAHESEPGCAIQQALSDNKITMKRFNNYKKILLEYTEK
jgi:ribosome biogenesis GTPase / thiamine phosphate phosphatase